MATRRSEWLASIKPILDRDDAKKDAAALAKELGDILEVKVDASPENLDELAKEFNAQLKTMGKQPIVFSEKTLRGIVSQFTKAISEGVSAGVAKVDFGAQLEELNKKREKILKAQNRANQAMKARTRMKRLENFNINTAELMPIDGDVAKDAQQLIDILYDSAKKIDQAAEKYGKSSSHYTSAVIEAQEAYNKYLRMQKTFGTLPPSKLSDIPKDVRALYDKLGPDREKYEAGGGLNIPFEETFEAEKILNSFEELSDAFEGIVDNATKYDKMLVQIDAKIEEITRKARESGGVDDGILSGAKDGLKTLNEIEAAYKRLKVDKGTKLRQQNESHIKSALDFDPAKNNVGIKTFAKDYYEAASSGDWVEEYHALLRYVKLYESYLDSTNKTHQNKVTAKNNPFTPLYEQLKPMAENARNMLQNILNLGENKPLVGMDGAEKENKQDGFTKANNAEKNASSNKIAADEKAREREEAEKKAQADKHSADANRKAREEAEAEAEAKAKADVDGKAQVETARQKKIEEESAGKASEQKRINDQASADAAKEELALTKQRVQVLEQFDNEHRRQMRQGEQREAAAQVDSKTGNMERFVVGKRGSVELPGSIVEDTEWGKQKPHLDTGLHTHWTNVAAPSPYVKDVTERGDLNVFKDRLNYQRLEIIRAMQEALFLDFSKISETALDKLIQEYNEFSEKIYQEMSSMTPAERSSKFGNQDGFNNALNQRLKDGFVQLTNKYPGFAEYVEKPMWPETYLEDEYQKADQEVKDIINRLSALQKKMETHDLSDSEDDIRMDLEKKLREIRPDLWNVSIDQWDKLDENIIGESYAEDVQPTQIVEKYEKASASVKSLVDNLVALDQQMQTLDKRTSATNMDGFDKWNPSDEHKNTIVNTLNEYQRVMKQISDFSIETDDDKKKLIELKEEALQLANTLKMAYRSDSNPDSYIKEYGVSREQAGAFMDVNNVSAQLHNEIRKTLNDSFSSTFKQLSVDDAGLAKAILDDEDSLSKLAVAATSSEKAVDSLNNSLKETQILTGGDTESPVNIGGVSTEELESEKTKVESLQADLEQKNSELIEKDKEIQRVKSEKDIALQAANDEKKTLQNDLDVATRQNAELRERASNDGDALWVAEQRANEAEERANYFAQKLAETPDVGEKQSAVNTEELKTLLNSIVYNVKIAHDDNDKTANKIALDDSTLEATLTKVFANILNPQTQQNDSAQTEKHWALEGTLQSVKGVLDNIQTNTAKIGAVKPSNVNMIEGTALDSRLVEIKSVLESINGQIVKGGVITTRGAVKQAASQPVESETKAQSARSNMMKSLINDYKTMGKLSARFASDNNLETKATLDNLKEEIARKRQSLSISMDENKSLREKYSIAFDAEKRLLDAAKAQNAINKQNKADAKDAENAWKKQVKDAQRATGINAATSAANAGDQTVVRAIGTEGVSKDIENKAKELSDQIKALRALRDEIDKKGEQASDADRDRLSKQISKVKELKTEVDGYLKIHEKYSGDNVTDLGDASNFGAVGSDQYWNNITAAIQNASSGKVVIKGLNADTGELTGTTKIAANTFAQWTATVDPLTGRLSMLRTGIKKTETIIEQIKRKTKEIFTYFSGSSLIFKAVNELKKGIQYVREIDLALTELKKVTDETEETYDRFLKTAAKTGERLGSTISAVTEATATFAKLGYSMQQASEMAEAAIVYKNVGDNIASTEDAADSIISTLKGFGLEASESMAIVDKFNEVGNRFAITSQGIGEALRLSASALNEGKNSLDESIALITAANEVVNDPSSVGTALKTLTLRLRGSKTELEEMGEDVSDMATTTSQLQAKLLALTGGKVDIMLNENEFKNSTQILREMAAAWEDMTDIQRASALELMGGKRQANTLSALIQNFDTVEKVIETSANSSGSALKENERYLDSIQGKIDQFNNATQAMWSNFLDADVVKFVVEIGTWLIKVIDKVGLLKSVLITLATISMVKNKQGPIAFLQGISDMITGAASKVKGYTTSVMGMVAANTAVAQSAELTTVGSLKNAMAVAKVDVANKNAILSSLGLASADKAQAISRDTLAASTIGAMVAEGQLTQAQANTIMSLLGISAASNEVNAARMNELLMTTSLTSAQRGQIITQLGLSGSLKQLSAAEVMNALTSSGMAKADAEAIMAKLGLTAANKGLAASFMTLWTAVWPILAVMGAVAVIWGVVKGVDALIPTTEEYTEKLNDMKSELQDTQSELDSVNSELQTTKERMAELIAMPSLSFVEQEELNKLKEENEELERRERLLKAQEEREKKRIAEQAVKTVESQLSDTSYTGSVWDAIAVSIEGALAGAAAGAVIGSVVPGIGTAIGAIAGAIGGGGGAVGGELLANRISTEDKVNQEIEEYKRLASEKERLEKELETASDEGTGLFGWGKSDYEKTKKELENIEKELGETETYIDGVIKQMGSNLDGVEYGYGADEILSFYDNLQYEFEIARGTIGAESDAIANIFNRPEYEATYNEIKRLQGELEKDPGNQTYLAQISEQCKKAEEDLISVGLSADKAFEYFTMKSGSSVDDIMAQYKVAKTALEDLKSGAVSIDDLVKYDEETGEATGRPDAIAEKLQGVAPEVREQFASIVEAIKEGSYDTEDGLTNWDAAIKKLELQGMQAVIASVKTELEAANKLAFPDLEISGWIDSVEELRGAFESLSGAMDLIVTAQEQMNSSGRISMKTALDLMATTDDWNQILEVNNGVITMNANAEQILIQSKLDLIKANIEMALQQVETDIALMEGAINSTQAGNAFTQGFTKALIGAQGILVGLKAGWDAFWAGEDVASAFNNARKTTVDNLTPDESSLGELYAQRDKLQKQREMLNGVDTTQEFKNNYDFDKNPGDKYGDSEDDAFQREMDYWENRIAANQAKYEQLQNEIDLLEAKGQKADASFYEEQIELEKEREWLLGEQKKAAEAHLATLTEGSEEWWEVANTLNDIEGELDDVTASIVDLQDAIGEIDAYKFEEFNTRLDNLTSKLGTIRDLIAPNGEEDWFDEEGNWTEEGVAVLGTYIQELETYKQGLAEVQDSMSAFNTIGGGAEWSELTDEQKDAYANQFGIHSEQEYYDKQEELIGQQYDYMSSISDTEQSIVDMYESSIDAVEEYVDTLIDGYNDYIDSVKEALDAERDLYDFKKNVQKQAKDISEIERRIASLSSSTNAADIAERRKLEAQLYESRESLNDTYYDHAKDSQNEALDAEASAYEESMTKFVEGLRTSLTEATANMDEFLMGVTSMVMYNADTILTKYEETNLPLTKELTNPWEEAKKATSSYSGNALDLMNQWTKEGGFFAQFNSTGTKNLQSPWSAGTTAANSFKTSVSTVMSGVVSNIATNVKTASGELSKLYQQIIDTEARAASANVVVDNGGSGGGSSGGGSGGGGGGSQKSMHHVYSTVKEIILGSQSYVDNNTKTIDGVKYFLRLSDGFYYKISDLKKRKYDGGRTTGWAIPAYTAGYSYYAKGTTGISHDEWAITDEPQFGDELVLVPGKDGNLSFMRKGTGVVPADLTANLMEWGQFTPDSFNLGGGVNVNMINNAVIKPQYDFSFDSLVHVDHCDQGTLKDLEKMVDNKIDKFSKDLNYSLKRFAR